MARINIPALGTDGTVGGPGGSPINPAGVAAALPVSIVEAGSTDALGRTQVMGTSTIQAPSLQQMVTVMDSIGGNPGAAGNANRVTDGAIMSGQATLSSASANFTTADAGKHVDVVGAGSAGGTNNGVLFATISSVSGGVATLSVNASQTVTGATVTYGTEDTTAIAAAHSAVSTAGGGVVHFVPGRNYIMGRVTPASNVTTWAYGATIYFTSGASTLNNCGFSTGSAVVNNWTLLGANMPYDGVTYGSGTRVAVYITTTGSTNIKIRDCTVSNNGDAAFNLSDCSGVWIEDSTVTNCCSASGRNAISVFQTVGTANDVTLSGNTVTNCPTFSIYLGGLGSTTMTTRDLSVTVTSNKVYGTTGAAYDMEVNGSGGQHGGGVMNVVIANNIANLTSGDCMKIGGGVVANTAPNLGWTIQGNRLATASGGGISLSVSDVTVSGNAIAPGPANGAISSVLTTQTVTATLDGTSNILTSVSSLAGDTPVVNRTYVTGTGIPAGTYLLAGSGTSTWTLSQNTTSAATETVTCYVTMSNVNVTGNGCHMPASSTGTCFGFTVLSDSNVSNNTCYYEPGSSSSTAYGLSIASSFDTSIQGNRFTNSPGPGVSITNCHDCDLTNNRLRNANQNGTPGVYVNIATSYNVDIDLNRLKDDNPAGSMMTQGIFATSTACGNLRARQNRISGSSVTSPIQTSGGTLTGWTEVTGNIVDPVTTTIAVLSNGQTLPQSTINVVSTAGFPASGTFLSPTAETITYTGISPTTFTGCTGGSSTLATGGVVSQPLKNTPLAPSAISYPGSGSAYINADPFDEYVIVSGGTVTAIAISRNGGTTYYTTGLTAGQFFLKRGDYLKCTSSGNPTTFEKIPV